MDSADQGRFVREPKICLQYAEDVAFKLSTKFHRKYPISQADARFGPAQEHFNGCLIHSWLIFVASETLTGLGQGTENDYAKKLGEVLRRSLTREFEQAVDNFPYKFGVPWPDDLPSDPFVELSKHRHHIHQITVLNTEIYVVEQILAESFSNPPEGSKDELRTLLRAGVYALSETVGFENPYDLLREVFDAL